MRGAVSKKRKLFFTLSAVLVAGVIYYFLVTFTSFRIPCFFHLVTGLKCPGCGVSTIFVEASHLNIAAAFAANPFLFVTFPFIVFELVWAMIRTQRGTKNPRANEILLWIYIGLLLAWGVIRNIFGI